MEIFSFPNKPIISLDKIHKYERNYNKSNENLNNDGYLNMLYIYRRFFEQSENDEKIKRLIENIDPEMKNIFDEVLKMNEN